MIFDISPKDLSILDNCPICNSQKIDTIANVLLKGQIIFQTSFCPNCDHVFRDQCPNIKWFKNAWKLRLDDQKKNKESFLNNEVEDFRIYRYKQILNNILPLIKIPRVLDIGAGTGSGLYEWKQKIEEIYCIEPDESRGRIAAEKYGLDVIYQDIYNVKLQRKFGLISMIHSLEHMHDLSGVFGFFEEHLENDGIVYIEVPNAHKFVTDWNDALYLAHYYNFSRNSLQDLFEKYGYYPLGEMVIPDDLSIGFVFSRQIKNKISATKKKLQFYQDRYRRGIHEMTESNLTFVVDELNDLSLLYKPDIKVHGSVSANYQTRHARYDKSSNRVMVKASAAPISDYSYSNKLVSENTQWSLRYNP